MENDLQLLRRYAEGHSEGAFAELVNRHVGWAYGAALRQAAGDTLAAQDITQAVFIDLAAKAAAIPENTILIGWLHRAIRLEARALRRSEARRRLREEAAAMQQHQDGSEPDWEAVKPVLDESLGHLREADRLAILLRFFDQRSLKEIGALLRCGESGASRRLSRSLDRLRAQLARRGIHTTAGALSAALLSHAAPAAPAGLAGLVTAASLAAAAAPAAPLLTFLTMTKLQFTAAALALAGLAVPLYLEVRENRALHDGLSRLQAENERLAARQAPLPAMGPGASQPAEDERAELARLRREIAALRQARAAAEAAAASPSARNPALRDQGAPNSMPPQFVPIAKVQNAGLATPSSAFETYSWAKAARDLPAMANALVLDDNARTRAQALLESLPEEQRSHYPSAEYLVASLIAETTEVAGLHVTGETPLGQDEASVHAEWQYNDGRIRDGDLRYHHYPDGWRQVIPEQLVGKLGGLLNQQPLGGGK